MLLNLLQTSSNYGNFFFMISIVLLILLVIFLVVWKLWKNTINRLQKNQQSLKQSFFEIIDSTKDGFMLFDKNNQFVHGNDQGSLFLTNTLGCSYSYELDISEIINKLNKFIILGGSTLLFKEGTFQEFTNLTIIESEGNTKQFYIRMTPILNKKKISYTYILCRDISEQIAKKKNDKKQSLINSDIMTYSLDGYIIIDRNYVVTGMNHKAATLLNLTKEDSIRCSLLDIFPELLNSELITKCEYAQIQQESLEFEFFFIQQSCWYNIKLQPNKFGLALFFYDNTLVKLNSCFNRAERKALEDFSKREISFYQIMAKSIDMFQELFPGVFCTVYALNESEDELKFVSSGYSAFISTPPKRISSDFLGFEFILNNKLKLEKESLYFDFLNELFSGNYFTKILSRPIVQNDKSLGLLICYIKKENESFSNLELMQGNLCLLIEKLFNYRQSFRELEKLSIVSEKSSKAYATVNIDEQITWTNYSFNSLIGGNKNEQFYGHITEIFNAQSMQLENFIMIMESIRLFEPLDITFPFVQEGKEIKQIHLIMLKIFSGDEIHMLIEIDDITKQMNYERLLVQGQQFLKKITDTVPIVLFQCEINRKGDFSFPFISKEIERLGIGLDIDLFYNQVESIFNLIYKEDLPKTIQAIEVAQRKRLSWNVEFRVITKDGSLKWINGVGVHERTRDGSYLWNGYLEDITDKKAKIGEIEEINERFVYASKAVNEVIWERNFTDNSILWSDGLTSIFGYTREFFPSVENLFEYIHPEDIQNYINEHKMNRLNKDLNLYSSEYRFKKADDSYAYVIDRGFILRDESGEPKRIIGSIKDVSEAKLFEKRNKELIKETQEFERNQFSMELHDGLAQQLVVLSLYLNQIEDEIPDHAKARIEICKKIVINSLNLTRTLCYDLSPPELSNGIAAGLNSLFDRLNILKLIEFKLDFGDTASLKIVEDLDIYNIYRIIQESINNSIKHSECTEIECSITASKNREKVSILIQDNGKGYDTKKVKYGFGIQNMQKRANLANVKIKILSKVGEGSTLIITTP